MGRYRHVAVIGTAIAERRSNIDADIRKAVIAGLLRFFDLVDDFRLGLGDHRLRLRFGDRLRHTVHLILETIQLIALIGQFALQAIVLALQALQRRHDVVEFVETLENLRAAIGILFRQILDRFKRIRNDVADAARANQFAACRLAVRARRAGS